jgi:3-hydroxyisobutyrate dehydrogenase-like beta-hydroxyacid dehydrogenase
MKRDDAASGRVSGRAQSNAKPIVGVLGTGRMGGSMSRALANAGFPLYLYNRTPERAVRLAEELGARAGATPAEVARNSNVIISSVADGAAVEALYEGRHGVIAGLKPGSVVADMSTVLPETILGLETAIRSRGAGVLDAPVSGSVSLATAGQLTIMVGGTDKDLERARPVLEALAAKIFHVGPLGSAAAMKLAVNAVIFGLNQALSEGLTLAEAAGIDRSTAYDVLAASAVAAPYVGYKRAAFIAPEETPAAFSLELAQKDLRLIALLAKAVGSDVPQARANLDLLIAAAATEGSDADLASVAGHIRRLARGPAVGATASRTKPAG